MGRLVFFDLETGGLDPRRNPIIQLGAVAVDSETLAEFDEVEIKIRFDERKAAKFALRKNSYSRRLWNEEALPPEQAARAFSGFLRQHAAHRELTRDGHQYRLAQLVAHNAVFDGPFLEEWYRRLRIYCPARRQVLCTLQRAKWHFVEHAQDDPPTNFKLETLCQYFGVPLSAAEAHDALHDARATVGLYRALRRAASSLTQRQAA